MLEAISFKDNKLQILNQLKLPLVIQYENIKSVSDAWNAIKSMKVRGAPAIAIVGMISIAVELLEQQLQDKQSCLEFIERQCKLICTSRPTAVNIRKEAEKLVEFATKQSQDSEINLDLMVHAIVEYAGKLLEDDVAVNRLIGDYGAQHIIDVAMSGYSDSGDAGNVGDSITILTHCNTGSLATAGYGTALGVIRSLHDAGKLKHAYCTETRPYNQGARLTSWELIQDKIPSTLICDSMVAALMRSRKISAVVVGADRVVADGSVANKIGTFQIAICAKYHQVPFYVASPESTIDMTLKSGDQIEIEERPESEMKCIGDVPIAAPEIRCWNPSFDITPAELITGGIITQYGVFPANQLEKDFK